MTMRTFKETYTNANGSVNPSDELVNDTRMKMIDPSSEPSVNMFYRGERFRTASIIVCCSLLLTGIAVLSINIYNQKGNNLPFNKIDNIYSAAPRPDSGVFGGPITTEEIAKYLGYSLTECLPESLSTFEAVNNGLYNAENHLLGLSVSFVQNLPERYDEKVFYCEIVDTSMSSGVLTIDYMYFDTTMETGDILGTAVVALERPQFTFTNEATGYKREEPAVYIAEFTAGTNYYYIEARHGITKSEFVEFVTNLIENVNANANVNVSESASESASANESAK